MKKSRERREVETLHSHTYCILTKLSTIYYYYSSSPHQSKTAIMEEDMKRSFASFLVLAAAVLLWMAVPMSNIADNAPAIPAIVATDNPATAPNIVAATPFTAKHIIVHGNQFARMRTTPFAENGTVANTLTGPSWNIAQGRVLLLASNFSPAYAYLQPNELQLSADQALYANVNMDPLADMNTATRTTTLAPRKTRPLLRA